MVVHGVAWQSMAKNGELMVKEWCSMVLYGERMVKEWGSKAEHGEAERSMEEYGVIRYYVVRESRGVKYQFFRTV